MAADVIQVAETAKNERRSPVRFLLKYIPGTREHRRVVARVVGKISHESLGVFMSIQTLDDPTKADLRPRVRRSLRRLARIEAWAGAVDRRFLELLMFGLAISFVAAPCLAVMWVDAEVGMNLIWYLPLAFVVQGFTLWWATAPFDDASDRAVLAVGVLASLASAVGLYGVSARDWLGFIDPIQYVVASTLLTILLLFVFALAVAGISAGTQYIGNRFMIVSEPRASTLEALLRSVYWTEEFDHRYSDEDLRQMMQWLEVAALGTEHAFRRRFEGGDPATDAWLTVTCNQAAAALRQEKRALFALKTGGTEALAGRLAVALEQVVREEWASLRRARVSSMHVKRSRRLITLVSTLLKALTPLVALLALQETRFALGDKASAYAIGIAAIWAVVTFLYQYDPLFTPKLDALTKVAGLRDRG